MRVLLNSNTNNEDGTKKDGVHHEPALYKKGQDTHPRRRIFPRRMGIGGDQKTQQRNKKQFFLKNDFHNLLYFQVSCHHAHPIERSCQRFIARLKYPHQGRESKASNFKTL